MTMKILFLNSEAELYNNGSDKIMLLSLQALQKYYDLHVLLPENGPLVEAIQGQQIPCKVLPYAVLRRQVLNPVRALFFIFHLLWSTVQIYRYIKKHDISIVFSNTLSILQGALLRKFCACKHIWHIHDIVEQPKIANKSFSYLASHYSDLVICVSNAVKQHLFYQTDNIHVIWNGIHAVAPAQVKKKKKKMTLAVLGRFNQLKGQHHLIHTVKILKKGPLKNTDFQVLLVGGTYKGKDFLLRKNQDLIHRLGLGNVIRIVDSVRDISQIYAQADIIVIPSNNPDPFPTVGLEAMSTATPFIAHDIGGLSEMLNFDPECLTACGDHQELATKLERFIIDDNFRNTKAIEQHQRYLKLFTFEKYQQRLNNLIGEKFNHSDYSSGEAIR